MLQFYCSYYLNKQLVINFKKLNYVITIYLHYLIIFFFNLLNISSYYCRLARCLFDLNRPHEAQIVMENFRETFPEYTNNTACKTLRKDIKETINSSKDSTSTKTSMETRLSDYEKEWRENAIDFKLRLCGHCNTITDIKEANFFGE